jgi:hypothetical protein
MTGGNKLYYVCTCSSWACFNEAAPGLGRKFTCVNEGTAGTGALQ